MASERIKVGFIGLSATGWAATALGPSLVQLSIQTKYKLVAVSTTSEASAKASAEKHAAEVGSPVKAYHGDSSIISSDPDVDLVVVSVKAQNHKKTVLPVIEKKKDFFIEWPAGTGLKESLEIAEAAKKHGVKTFVGLQARNSLVIRKIKELVASGAIGTVRSTTFIGLVPRESHFWPPVISEGHVSYTTNRANGATALNIAGGHQLDPLTFILGDFSTISATATNIYDTVTVVTADGKPTGQTLPNSAPDHYTISGRLKSGAVASIVWRVGYPSTPGRRHLVWEIDGEEGSIRIESDNVFQNIQAPKAYLNGKEIVVEGDGGLMSILGGAWEAYADGAEGYYANMDDAIRNHRILDAVERSIAAEGKTIVL